MSALYSLFCALQPPSTYESVGLNEETTMTERAHACVSAHRGLWHWVAGGNGCILLQQSSSVQDAVEQDEAVSH